MRELLFLLFVVSCASSSVGGSPDGPLGLDGELTKNPEPASLSPEYHFAEQFDRWVNGSLGAEEKKELIAKCKSKTTENPFCPAIQHAKELEKRIKVEAIAEKAPEPREVIPSKFAFKGAKVLNWGKLKRDSIPSLLKGVQALSFAELTAVGAYAQTVKACPNPVAAAVAATYEDSLPEKDLDEKISKLYEVAGRCAPKNSADREHFLTRSGLFHYVHHRYADAEKVLERVVPQDAFAGRALYWLYRVRKQLGKQAAAEQARRALLNRHIFSFHAALVRSSETIPEMGTERVKRSKSKEANKFLQQVELLSKNRFEKSAAFMAWWTNDRFPKLETDVKLYLAELGDAELRVLVGSDILIRHPKMLDKRTVSIAYPRPFPTSFQNQSGVDPYLLWSLARKESVFNPKVVSVANAQGLLQLRPETAERMESGSSKALLDPDRNIEVAARYVKNLSSRFDGKIPLIIAAYNAGEDPVTKWLKRYPTQDTILFVDMIPYRETREYVSFVLSNYHWYHVVYAGNDPLRDMVSSEMAIAK